MFDSKAFYCLTPICYTMETSFVRLRWNFDFPSIFRPFYHAIILDNGQILDNSHRQRLFSGTVIPDWNLQLRNHLE